MHFTKTVFVILGLIIISIILLLICPININLLAYYSNKYKKLFFTVLLFENVCVFSGYLTKRKKGGVYLHLKNKAIIIEIKASKILNNNLNFNKFITISACNFFIITGVNSVGKIFGFYTVASALKTIFSINNCKTDLNFIDLYIDLENSERLESGAKISVRFNIIRILFMIIANYINKVIKNAKKLKTQN